MKNITKQILSINHIGQLTHFLTVIVFFLLLSCSEKIPDFNEAVVDTLKDAVLDRANRFLNESPLTVTNDICDRSAGGVHDFYSEGDYWWPNPEDPEGPFIRKDGLTNPENFIAHRQSLMRFSEIVGTLTSAYLLTDDPKYAESALKHCKAWLIDEHTKMNPNLLYSQAIKGRFTGRDTGIIDGIHFMDIAQSLVVLEDANQIKDQDVRKYKEWFSEFIDWLTTHPYGIGERDRKNNHATWWNTQVALYADYVGNQQVLNFCIENYKSNLLPNQMAPDGSFPEELGRTKPYSYSLFNLDAMGMFCQVASDTGEDLWNYEVNDKSMRKALEFMAPFVDDKGKWPYPPDIQYWENWPVAHPSFLFGAIALNNEKYFHLWKENEHFPEEYEIRRTIANKSPIIWLPRAGLATPDD